MWNIYPHCHLYQEPHVHLHFHAVHTIMWQQHNAKQKHADTGHVNLHIRLQLWGNKCDLCDLDVKCWFEYYVNCRFSKGILHISL